MKKTPAKSDKQLKRLSLTQSRVRTLDPNELTDATGGYYNCKPGASNGVSHASQVYC